jgi:hypothetical protein
LFFLGMTSTMGSVETRGAQQTHILSFSFLISFVFSFYLLQCLSFCFSVFLSSTLFIYRYFHSLIDSQTVFLLFVYIFL